VLLDETVKRRTPGTPGTVDRVAHSTEPAAPLMKWMSDLIEGIVWHIPSISLRCRAVSVLPSLETLGCKILFRKYIGVPLWPFLVFVVEKPASLPTANM
jgi:hypothetical protein